MSDLMPKRARREPGPHRVHVATYEYADELGEPVFQVLRYVPKAFRQRRPDGKGGWIWNLRGVRRLLYRLPELLAADPTQTVFICEGEKDVDRLRSLGLVATTNPGGAGKWQREYAEALRGRRVVVIADNDEPGRRHAVDMARSLDGAAAKHCVLALPGLDANRKDVSDWLDAGHTADELERLAHAMPEGETERPPEDLAALLDAVTVFEGRFVRTSEAQATISALWVAHTWAIDAANATPFLIYTSATPECGKTRALEILTLLVRNPRHFISPSEAVLFRTLHAQHPTLLLDEEDAVYGPNAAKDNEGLRALMNAGNRRGVTVPRCVRNGADISVVEFEVFGPRALALIGTLPPTVESRSIRIVLQRRRDDEPLEDLGPYELETAEVEAATLRGRLAVWAALAIESLRRARPSFPAGLRDRQKEGLRPLLAIADIAGGAWPEKARRAVVALCLGKNADEDSNGVRLLRDVFAVFKPLEKDESLEKDERDRISSAALCEALGGVEESPWSEWTKGNRISKTGLARLLKPFGIVPGTIRLHDGSTPKGYYWVAFTDAWNRYRITSPLPSGISNATPPQANPDAGLVSSSKRHKGDLVADEKRGIVNTDAPCGVVADEKASRGTGTLSVACAFFWGEQVSSPCKRCGRPYGEHEAAVADRRRL
jgi:5S rRNA maturation endonuclease (ribonuclease M5)